jgi:UDP-N-acetylmuramoyl-tripeptide--D-alanyl-D-alanine ligase
VSALNFDEIITVGNEFKKVNTVSKAYQNSKELSDYLKSNKIESKNILLKGSRGIALEQILEFIN